MMNGKLLEQIRALRLGHVSNALELQWSQPVTYTSLSFEERLSLLLEHELLQREVTKVNRLRRQSKLRLDAQASRLDYRTERGLNRPLLAQLQNAQGKWTMPIQNWNLTLSQLGIFFEGRLNRVITL